MQSCTEANQTRKDKTRYPHPLPPASPHTTPHQDSTHTGGRPTLPPAATPPRTTSTKEGGKGKQGNKQTQSTALPYLSPTPLRYQPTCSGTEHRSQSLPIPPNPSPIPIPIPIAPFHRHEGATSKKEPSIPACLPSMMQELCHICCSRRAEFQQQHL